MQVGRTRALLEFLSLKIFKLFWEKRCQCLSSAIQTFCFCLFLPLHTLNRHLFPLFLFVPVCLVSKNLWKRNARTSHLSYCVVSICTMPRILLLSLRSASSNWAKRALALIFLDFVISLQRPSRKTERISSSATLIKSSNLPSTSSDLSWPGGFFCKNRCQLSGTALAQYSDTDCKI